MGEKKSEKTPGMTQLVFFPEIKLVKTSMNLISLETKCDCRQHDILCPDFQKNIYIKSHKVCHLYQAAINLLHVTTIVKPINLILM